MDPLLLPNTIITLMVIAPKKGHLAVVHRVIIISFNDCVFNIMLGYTAKTHTSKRVKGSTLLTMMEFSIGIIQDYDNHALLPSWPMQSSLRHKLKHPREIQSSNHVHG